MIAFKFIAQVKKAKFPEKGNATALQDSVAAAPSPQKAGASGKKCDAQTRAFLKVMTSSRFIRLTFVWEANHEC